GGGGRGGGGGGAGRGRGEEERPRAGGGPPPLPLDARGRRGAQADGDRSDHGLPDPRGAAARRACAAPRDHVPADQGEGGLLAGERMRVCIVGCGAVGSLFAANLGTLDDVEVWAYDLMRDHVDAINRDGLRLTGAGKVV